VQGTLPDAWGTNGAFPSLRLLTLNRNWQLTGSLPATWGNSSDSLQRLEVLTMHDCNLTGTLPPSWAANMVLLSVVDLSNNWLSGSAPPATQLHDLLAMPPSASSGIG
jgi:hypothetical protein